MILIKDITNHLESDFPLAYQENYDNSGLLIGNPNIQVTKILVSLDCTEKVLDEAIKKNCNLVIAHHPVIFKGIKKINGTTDAERTILKAIKNDIAIYACHTPIDNVAFGVNYKIAEKLGLSQIKVLSAKQHILKKLTVFVPKEHTETVSEAIFQAGAGHIGNYKNCSFLVEGTGSFVPTEGSKPSIGTINNFENVTENRIEYIFPSYLEHKIIAAMKSSHPYEEVAYYISVLENKNQLVGSGAIGVLDKEISIKDFIVSILKPIFDLKTIKHTENEKFNTLQKKLKIAVCGGSGVFLLKDAIHEKADIFITSDIKYHDYFDAEKELILTDIGHYESEQFTKEIFYAHITKKFTNIAVLLSETNTNPVKYL